MNRSCSPVLINQASACRRRLRAAGVVAAVLLILLGATLAAPPRSAPVGAASPDTTYDLSWWTVDGGGAIFVHAGSYTLGGTIAQPDAGEPVSAGGYTLKGGFWSAAANRYYIHLPLVTRAAP